MNRKNLFLIASIFLLFQKITAQNALFIPDTLSGLTFNLNIQKGTKSFYPGYTTNTFGYNGSFLGPTLILNKGDSVTINVKNTFPVEKSTVHWHGIHLPAKYDGGPHQLINPGTTWSPRFKVMNNAATYWYHAHMHMKTEIQVSKGLAGMIIIRDNIEAGYNLPRHYKVDDFPLIVQTRIFDAFYQIGTATHDDTVLMVNGTMKPYLSVPQQIVRFRLLNGSSDRTYYFGLSDNSDFYLIASDGGLLAKPDTTKRLRLSPGERAEVLVNFGNYTVGQSLYLKSYASELPKGIIGADSVGTSTLIIQDGYYQNPLNGVDFNILRFDVAAPTANPVTTIPVTFAPITYIPEASANASQHLHFSPDFGTSGQQAWVDGPFFINNKTFHMDSINIKTYLGNTEIWTLTNKTLVAHPFHIHDIQFFILDINGNPPPPALSGYKDVVLVQPGDSIRFITTFDDFMDPVVPFMYHCHLLHHEDDGMMGSFVVLDSTNHTINIPDMTSRRYYMRVYQNMTEHEIFISLVSHQHYTANIYLTDMLGRKVKNLYNGYLQKGENRMSFNISDLSNGLYILVNEGEQTMSQKIIR